jgi:uncharacterized protein YacL
MANVIVHHPRGTTFGREHDESVPRVSSEAWLREQFGGFSFGSAFFGWIVASGIGVLLTAVLAAAGSAVAFTAVQNGVTRTLNGVSANTFDTVGLVSGLLLLIAMGIAYFAGGYVAGRMARFNGARQGVGVWAIGLVITLALGAIGTMFGAKYNILQAINLPHLPVSQGIWTGGGVVTAVLMLVVTILAAITGAQAGVRYHQHMDELVRESQE